MRAIILLFCSVAFAFSPNGVLSQDAKIYFETDQVLTVDAFFDLLEKQTDYKFIYQEGIFDSYPAINVKQGTSNANKLIKKILSRANLEASLGKDNIILVRPIKGVAAADLPSNSQFQEYSISGLVLDENDIPLPGASVIEIGTSN